MNRPLLIPLASLALSLFSPPSFGEGIEFEVERRKEDVLLSVKAGVNATVELGDGQKEGLLKGEWKKIPIPYWKFPEKGYEFDVVNDVDGGGRASYILDPLRKVDGSSWTTYNPILRTKDDKTIINEIFSYGIKDKFCWDFPDWIFTMTHRVGDKVGAIASDPKMILGSSEKEFVENGEFDIAVGGYLLDLVRTSFGEYTLDPKYTFKSPNGVWNCKIVIDDMGLDFTADFIFNSSSLMGEGGRFGLYEG